MRLRLIPGLLAAIAVSGCALLDEHAPRGMRWAVGEATRERASLALGVPQTDDLQMLLSCHPFSGAVDVTVVGRRGDGAVVEMRSGEVRGRYPGAGHEDQETLGGVDIDLKLAAADPVLERFAASGKLDLGFSDGRWVRLPNGFAQAHDFLRLCRRPVGAR